MFASSAAIYGIPQILPISEDASMTPISPYGASKAASELYLKVFEENQGIESVSLRYFNVYGPRQTANQYSGVVSIFSRRINRKMPLTIYGEGSQSRDFIHVLDAVNATIAALEKENLQDRVFNIAAGAETTILQLAKTMQDITEVGSRSELKFRPPRKGDISRSVADITRAEKQLGFRPAVPLRRPI